MSTLKRIAGGVLKGIGEHRIAEAQHARQTSGFRMRMAYEERMMGLRHQNAKEIAGMNIGAGDRRASAAALARQQRHDETMARYKASDEAARAGRADTAAHRAKTLELNKGRLDLQKEKDFRKRIEGLFTDEYGQSPDYRGIEATVRRYKETGKEPSFEEIDRYKKFGAFPGGTVKNDKIMAYAQRLVDGSKGETTLPAAERHIRGLLKAGGYKVGGSAKTPSKNTAAGERQTRDTPETNVTVPRKPAAVKPKTMEELQGRFKAIVDELEILERKISKIPRNVRQLGQRRLRRQRSKLIQEMSRIQNQLSGPKNNPRLGR